MNVFDEAISKRCDEILLGDEQYVKFNNKIIQLESEFKLSLSSQQRSLYDKLEKMILNCNAYENELIYKTALRDNAKKNY